MTPSQADPLEAAIAAALDPLREQIRVADTREEELQTELAILRERRKRALQALRALAPDDPRLAQYEQNRPGPKKKAETKKGRANASPETLEVIEQFLRKHYNGDTFTAPGVTRHPEWNRAVGRSRATADNALTMLHERGVIRLDGLRGSPPTRTFRLAERTK